MLHGDDVQRDTITASHYDFTLITFASSGGANVVPTWHEGEAIPLLFVAPDERRNEVIQQVNRPTFDRMKPPLVEVCRYISFDVLRENLQQAPAFVLPQGRLAANHQRVLRV